MTVNSPIHFTKQSNPIIQTRHEVCVYGREGGQITVTVFYTCCLTLSECRQTSVCTSPHSWHWQSSPLQSAFSLHVGFHSQLHLKTRPPSPVQYTQTNTVRASTSRASERGTTSQCNKLQPVHWPQALATDDTRCSRGNQKGRLLLLHAVQTGHVWTFFSLCPSPAVGATT